MPDGRWLNLELIDSTGAALAGRDYTIAFDGQPAHAGTLDADGRLHVQVPDGAARAALVIAYRRFELVLAALPDAATVAGAQERLNHLNYFAGDVDGQLGPFTAGALRRFQRAHGLAETGELDPPTVAALQERHGS
jgi:putative peptidoglycan binding protein